MHKRKHKHIKSECFYLPPTRKKSFVNNRPGEVGGSDLRSSKLT